MTYDIIEIDIEGDVKVTISWKDEVLKRREDLKNDLFTLLKIDSVRDDSKATAESPVGPGPREALEAFLAIAERDGFITKNIDNLAGHAEYGEGDETLGILGHVDVVPVDEYWTTDPFEPVIKDGRIYARGASDDKGPTIAAYYALKIIKELELPVSKKVRFIVGTDEESGWECMTRYFEVEPKPDFGFSPDAEFPIINGEKGMYSAKLQFPVLNGQLTAFSAGQRENMVPAQAKATLTIVDADQVSQAAAKFFTNEPVSVEVTTEGSDLNIKVEGKAAHAMAPHTGINAATFLARFLLTISDELASSDYLQFIANVLHEDFYGVNLEITHTDEIMGELTVNPGVFGEEEGKQFVILNIRVPKGKDFAELDARFEELAQAKGFTVAQGQKNNKPPHYVPADDPLVKTLLDVYHRQTGLEAHEHSIGGGTYGRLLERGVAYGAMFPDSIDTMHQANEFMAIDDILNSAAIYAEAIYELIK